jgi:3-deoxy-7-phosphoheptulonate synthase / chorismate mutase
MWTTESALMRGAASPEPAARTAHERVATRLDRLRDTIDSVDSCILGLISVRARVVLEIGDHKRSHGLAVHDPERERAVLDRTATKAGALDARAVRRIFQTIVEESRLLEEQHVRKP